MKASSLAGVPEWNFQPKSPDRGKRLLFGVGGCLALTLAAAFTLWFVQCGLPAMDRSRRDSEMLRRKEWLEVTSSMPRTRVELLERLRAFTSDRYITEIEQTKLSGKACSDWLQTLRRDNPKARFHTHTGMKSVHDVSASSVAEVLGIRTLYTSGMCGVLDAEADHVLIAPDGKVVAWRWVGD
ncbi:hypothetical protein PLCT2_01682 [Planctomycetaceae bacterium]|nr:hypothetical protein PLCT2_01682 [Planctomycetaceae bacterium]